MTQQRNVLVVGAMARQLEPKLAKHFTLHRFDGELDPAVAQHVDGIAMGGTDNVPVEVVDALPNCRMIACYGVGYDGINARHAAQKGIMVSHTPDVLNDEVANTAILLVLATMRRAISYDRYVRAGRWKSEGSPPLTHGLAGKKVGIVGMGRIGQAIAGKLSVFHCEIAYHSRNPVAAVSHAHFPDLTKLAEWSDVLILITPGGAATRHLVNRKVMEALGPEGTLVNVARGSVVDEAALVAVLREGRLGAAGLDVFEAEPHVPEELLAMENVVLLPHVGSATVETRGAMGDLVVDNLVEFFRSARALTPVPECRHMQED